MDAADIKFELYSYSDDFYNEYNQNKIKIAIHDIMEGKGTTHDLIEVSDE